MDNPGPPALPTSFPPGRFALSWQGHPRRTSCGRKNPAKPIA
jgi:hypothetical protein